MDCYAARYVRRVLVEPTPLLLYVGLRKLKRVYMQHLKHRQVKAIMTMIEAKFGFLEVEVERPLGYAITLSGSVSHNSRSFRSP